MTQKFTTPMAEARGSGSVHHGSAHWYAQRLSAICLVFLGVWVFYAIWQINELSYLEAVEWIALPWNAALLTGFLVTSLYHSALGWQVIIEDYVQCQCWKTYLIGKNWVGSILLGLLGFFFILRLVIMGTHS